MATSPVTQQIWEDLEELASPVAIRFSEIISALSYALDLTEGQPMGHAVRSCLIGMRIAQEVGLPARRRASLYYAMLMKDAGCSSNASHLYQILGTDEIKAKRDVKIANGTRLGWDRLQYALSHASNGRPWRERLAGIFRVAVNRDRQSREMVRIRSERGAVIARRIGLSDESSAAIRSLDEHWDGHGHPDGLKGDEIPLLARILNLAQTLETFHAAGGPQAAVEIAKRRNKRWFDPELVRAVLSLDRARTLWIDMDGENAKRRVMELEPQNGTLVAPEPELDGICEAFADVIDAKSSYTYRHSTGVADAAVSIAGAMGLPAPVVTMIRRAALLHDIGKLSICNAILEKPGKLTPEEWKVVHRHPYYTQQILVRIPAFRLLSYVAAAHHERLDGTGYFQHLTAGQLTLPARILAVADVFHALSAKRPYREALPREAVFRLLRKEAAHGLDADCVEVLAHCK